jgi:heptosyltransferase-3
VIYVSRIGDTMLVTPAVRALAQAWPAARVDFIGSAKSAEVFQHLPFVSRVRSLSKKRARLLGRFGRPSYDLALVYGYDGDGPFVEYALRIARNVIAFRQKKASLNPKLLAAVEKPAYGTCHAVDYALALVKPLGIPSAGRFLSYCVSAEERRWAQGELAPLREKRRSPLFGVQVASFPTKAYRDWPIENFVEVCKRAREHYPDSHFLIFGGPDERDRTLRLHGELRGCSTHYAGRLTLRQTAALMQQIDLYVGVDTGPTHIMGALHRPMVALYHPYSPSRLLAPLEHPCLYAVDHPAAGTGCGPETPMAGITVDEVWSRVRQALERR